jgi:rubrerythrin
MDSLSVTTAAIISFSEKLEDDSSTFYEALAERWPEQKDTFLAFAKEGGKNKTQVVRTYQETISDALEASYSFEGLDLAAYAVETKPRKDATYAEALKMALALEDKACAFYVDVAERSEALLATIPRAFKRVAKKREQRKSKLEALLENV